MTVQSLTEDANQKFTFLCALKSLNLVTFLPKGGGFFLFHIQ